MNKPGTVGGYTNEVTRNCERVLVTLLRGLGPWKNSVYLVGGLTPRYLVKAEPPDVPAHAGTGDVDIVVELQMLADTDAYYSLEENLKKLGFERAENHKGEKVSWRWRANTESGVPIILELLADDPEIGGGKVQPLPTAGNISALNIPHASMVFDHHETREISVELLGEDGVATETIRYADLVGFTCLKAFALDQRHERKDAYDLITALKITMPAWMLLPRHSGRRLKVGTKKSSKPHWLSLSNALSIPAKSKATRRMVRSQLRNSSCPTMRK